MRNAPVAMLQNTDCPMHQVAYAPQHPAAVSLAKSAPASVAHKEVQTFSPSLG